VFLQESGVDVSANLEAIDGKFMAAFVRATKPGVGTRRTPALQTLADGACCGPDCCL